MIFKTALKTAGLTLAGITLGYLSLSQSANAQEVITREPRTDLSEIAKSLIKNQKPLFYHSFEDGSSIGWFHCTKDYNPPQAKNQKNSWFRDRKGPWFRYEKEFRLKDRFGNTDDYSVAFFDLQPFRSIGNEDILTVGIDWRSINYSKWNELGEGFIFAIDYDLNGIGPEDNCGINNIRPHQAIQYMKDGNFDYASWYEDQLRTIKSKMLRNKEVKK